MTEGDDERAAELRHRTANTFQLMSALARMRGQRAGEPEARRQLLWMADAIGSLGALERHRCRGGVDFCAYLEEMAPVWRRRPQGETAAEVVVSATPLIAPDQVASTLALIVHELVANAVVHACDGRAGLIRVRLGPEGQDLHALEVSDDGPGFDPAAPDGRERFGLWFVRSLAVQVRGELKLQTQPSVVARLVFPMA